MYRDSAFDISSKNIQKIFNIVTTILHSQMDLNIDTTSINKYRITPYVLQRVKGCYNIDSSMIYQYLIEEFNKNKEDDNRVDQIWNFSIKQNGVKINIGIMVYSSTPLSKTQSWVRYIAPVTSDGSPTIVIGMKHLAAVGEDMIGYIVQDVFEGIFEWFISPKFDKHQRKMHIQTFTTLMFLLFFNATGKTNSTLVMDVSAEAIARMTLLNLTSIESNIKVLNLSTKKKRHQFANILSWMFIENDKWIQKVQEYARNTVKEMTINSDSNVSIPGDD